MRTSPAPIQIIRFLSLALILAPGIVPLSSSVSAAENLCPMLRGAWESVNSYDCRYRAVTLHEGKRTESVMRYRFQKPNKVRMDIDSPRKGAVLIYNPAVLDKVRVRPFPKMPSLVLKYALNHKRVSTDSGDTIDKSHLGGRIDKACENLAKSPEATYHPELNPRQIEEVYFEGNKKFSRRYYIDGHGLFSKIETRNERGEIESALEWTELKINPELDSKIFEDINAKP